MKYRAIILAAGVGSRLRPLTDNVPKCMVKVNNEICTQRGKKLKVGDITINIVDASKKEELADERNKVYLDPENVEVIDGEKVVVEKEQEQKESDDTSSQDKFFEAMGDE